MFALQAERRWCVTGTPIQNKLGDLFSLLAFLREEPWCNIGWWTRMIAKPFDNNDPVALKRLRIILNPLLLRRTKEMKDEAGNRILTLPERKESILYVIISVLKDLSPLLTVLEQDLTCSNLFLLVLLVDPLVSLEALPSRQQPP